MEEIAQRCYRFLCSSRHSPEQPAFSDPALSKGVDQRFSDSPSLSWSVTPGTQKFTDDVNEIQEQRRTKRSVVKLSHNYQIAGLVL